MLAANQKIRISSRTENIILVEKMIDGVCELFSINQDYYGNILVALTEAVNNAIYHGNKSNENKNIDITFKSSPTQVSFIVKDEGAGFDFDNLPDPTNPENVENLNGRGVFLMRHLADKVSYKLTRPQFSYPKSGSRSYGRRVHIHPFIRRSERTGSSCSTWRTKCGVQETNGGTAQVTLLATQRS